MFCIEQLPLNKAVYGGLLTPLSTRICTLD